MGVEYQTKIGGDISNFRSLEKLSYGLILEITDGVKVGDRLINPR